MRNKMLSIVMAAAVGILALTAGAQAFAGTESLVVRNVSVNGAIVLVTVKNVSLAPVVSSVTVEADVNGMSSFSIVPVVVLPGQSTVVSAAFTGSVSSVKSVGLALSAVADMSDEPTPM